MTEDQRKQQAEEVKAIFAHIIEQGKKPTFTNFEEARAHLEQLYKQPEPSKKP